MQSRFQSFISRQDRELGSRGGLFQELLFLRSGDTRCPVELIPESGIKRGALRLAGGDAADIAQGSLDQDGGRQVALLLAQAQRLAELRHLLVHQREARDVVAGIVYVLNRMVLNEKVFQQVLHAGNDERIDRVIGIRVSAYAQQVVQVPGVDVIGDLLLGR